MLSELTHVTFLLDALQVWDIYTGLGEGNKVTDVAMSHAPVPGKCNVLCGGEVETCWIRPWLLLHRVLVCPSNKNLIEFLPFVMSDREDVATRRYMVADGTKMHIEPLVLESGNGEKILSEIRYYEYLLEIDLDVLSLVVLNGY